MDVDLPGLVRIDRPGALERHSQCSPFLDREFLEMRKKVE